MYGVRLDFSFTSYMDEVLKTSTCEIRTEEIRQ